MLNDKDWRKLIKIDIDLALKLNPERIETWEKWAINNPELSETAITLDINKVLYC